MAKWDIWSLFELRWRDFCSSLKCRFFGTNVVSDQNFRFVHIPNYLCFVTKKNQVLQ